MVFHSVTAQHSTTLCCETPCDLYTLLFALCTDLLCIVHSTTLCCKTPCDLHTLLFALCTDLLCIVLLLFSPKKCNEDEDRPMPGNKLRGNHGGLVGMTLL